MNGTQLQRRLELEIRKKKDTQILARSSGDIELVEQSQNKIRLLTSKYNELCKASGLKPKKQRMSVSGYVRTKINNIKQNKLYEMNFDKTRNTIDNNSLSNLINNFDEKSFYTEYNKFYSSLDKNELLNINNEFTKWDGNGEQPIGKYLNKKLNYDEKPSLISKEEFFIDEDGNPSNGETMFLDDNHWYRGIEDSDIGKTKKYVEDFKYGDFYAGKGINGNGTYVTESHSYAERYSKYQEEGMLYIIPKDNAKIITVDKINLIKQDLLKNIDNYKLDNDLYIDFTTNIIGDNGYLASILGYDIVDLGEIKLVLNRGAIKVVE